MPPRNTFFSEPVPQTKIWKLPDENFKIAVLRELNVLQENKDNSAKSEK